MKSKAASQRTFHPRFYQLLRIKTFFHDCGNLNFKVKWKQKLWSIELPNVINFPTFCFKNLRLKWNLKSLTWNLNFVLASCLLDIVKINITRSCLARWNSSSDDFWQEKFSNPKMLNKSFLNFSSVSFTIIVLLEIIFHLFASQKQFSAPSVILKVFLVRLFFKVFLLQRQRRRRRVFVCCPDTFHEITFRSQHQMLFMRIFIQITEKQTQTNFFSITCLHIISTDFPHVRPSQTTSD